MNVVTKGGGLCLEAGPLTLRLLEKDGGMSWSAVRENDPANVLYIITVKEGQGGKQQLMLACPSDKEGTLPVTFYRPGEEPSD